MADALSTAGSALLAYQSAIATISNNVANATTRGYSRQDLVLTALGGTPLGGITIGGGVAATRIQRLADSLVFMRGVDASGELGRLGTLTSYASKVDKLITDPATGLGKHWSEFYAAAQDVVNEPTSTITRSALISQANQLASRWNSMSGQLRDLEADSNERLTTQVGVANQLAQQIASLNEKIKGAGANVSPELLDQRETKMTDLANIVGGTIVDQGDGSLSLFTENGLALVMGGKAMKLTTTTDPYNPLRSNVALETPNGTMKLAANALGGELGGIAEFRATVIDPARIELDREAAAFAHAYNEIQTTGVDYNGNLGKQFFSVPPPVIARNPGNTGTGAFSGSIKDLGKLDGQEIKIKFDGTSFTATNGTGDPVAMTGSGTAADPFVINGVELTMSGAPAAGDEFLLRPVQGAAEGLKVLVSDPNEIAAASPLEMKLGATNTGSVTASKSKITDKAAYAGFTGADIKFIDADHYTIDGGAPIAYKPGDKITGAGWELTLDGAPAPGDEFKLAPAGARSSDNGNARIFGDLDDLPIFDGGKVSLTNAMGQFTAKVGASAQLAEMNLDAQVELADQIDAERESVSGVNLDEEAGNLLKFQQAYSAASQLIATANQMFDDLLRATGR